MLTQNQKLLAGAAAALGGIYLYRRYNAARAQPTVPYVRRDSSVATAAPVPVPAPASAQRGIEKSEVRGIERRDIGGIPTLTTAPPAADAGAPSRHLESGVRERYESSRSAAQSTLGPHGDALGSPYRYGDSGAAYSREADVRGGYDRSGDRAYAGGGYGSEQQRFGDSSYMRDSSSRYAGGDGSFSGDSRYAGSYEQQRGGFDHSGGFGRGGDLSSSSSAGPSIGEKVGRAKDVIGTHAEAAKDDLSRARMETGNVISSHLKQAGRDVSTAAGDVKRALKGEPVDATTVHETPLQSGPIVTEGFDPKRVVRTNPEAEVGKRGY